MALACSFVPEDEVVQEGRLVICVLWNGSRPSRSRPPQNLSQVIRLYPSCASRLGRAPIQAPRPPLRGYSSICLYVCIDMQMYWQNASIRHIRLDLDGIVTVHIPEEPHAN
jgi:hypothetical protein